VTQASIDAVLIPPVVDRLIVNAEGIGDLRDRSGARTFARFC
jgi:hypothetical protein